MNILVKMYVPNVLLVSVSVGIVGIFGIYPKTRSLFTNFCGLRMLAVDDYKLQSKMDPESDTDEELFEVETGSEECPSVINKNVPSNICDIFIKMNDTNLLMQQRLNSVESKLSQNSIEQCRHNEERQESIELQLHRIEEYCVNIQKHNEACTLEVLDAVQKLQNSVDTRFAVETKQYNWTKELKNLMLDMKIFKDDLNTQEVLVALQEVKNSLDNKFAVETKQYNWTEELENLKLDMKIVKDDLNTLTTNVNDFRCQITVMEREVTKIYAHIVGMDHSFQTPLSVITNSVVGGAMTLSAGNGFDHLYPPKAYYHQATTSYPLVIPPPRPAPLASRPPPPPPSPPSPPSPPPPPAMMIVTTGTLTPRSKIQMAEMSSPVPKTKIYQRIPITTEILKSVKLKPPGCRTYFGKHKTSV